MAAQISGFGGYPNNDGAPALLDAISRWLNRRYGVTVATTEIMALNGTREGLYNAVHGAVPRSPKTAKHPSSLTPESLLSGLCRRRACPSGQSLSTCLPPQTPAICPTSMPCPIDVLDRTAIAYICSPANPQGAVASEDYWRNLINAGRKARFQDLR